MLVVFSVALFINVLTSVLIEKVMRCWHKLPREMVESLFLEVFKKHSVAVLRNMVWWRDTDGRWTAGLDNLEDYSSFGDSMNLITDVLLVHPEWSF